MSKKIIIVSGDPNSINSEIIFKSWKKIRNAYKKKIYFISNINLLKKQFKRLNYRIKLKEVKNIDDDKTAALKIINIDLKFKDPFKISNRATSNFITDSLNKAHIFGLRKDVKGIINCAISKSFLKKNKIGVTEYLASKCNLKKNTEVMMIYNDKLSVCPLTTHIDIKDVSNNINSELIIKKIKSINSWLKRRLKRKPKIGVIGLNPHNAEFRKTSEEKKIILPSILKLKKSRIKVDGPLVSDTIFINEYKNYDVIVGMYHDQVLSPFKTIYKFDAINITIGLKYLRVSPDHGIAKNLVGKNKANILSFLKCIEFIEKFKK